MFAAVHTAITVALVYWQEAPYWDYIPIVPTAQRGIPHDVTTYLEDGEPDLQDRAPVNPCESANTSERPTTPQERILAIDNLPVVLITGWHLPCGIPSRLDKRVQTWYGFTQEAESVVGKVISVLALVLWFIVGGFPMIRSRHRKWYNEPGIFMTVCAIVSMVFLGIGWLVSRVPADSRPPIPEYAAQTSDVILQLAVLPMLLVAIGWIWWVGLFFYTRWKKTRRWLDHRARMAES
jgi:hypothetical protein